MVHPLGDNQYHERWTNAELRRNLEDFDADDKRIHMCLYFHNRLKYFTKSDFEKIKRFEFVCNSFPYWRRASDADIEALLDIEAELEYQPDDQSTGQITIAKRPER